MEIKNIINTVINGNSLQILKTFPDESIDCVITSPPYYQLRDYGWEGQWGLEKTYQEYLDKMIELMRELKRILKPTGTMWINLGDTYSTISSGTRGLKRKEKQFNKISHKAILGQGFEQTKNKDYPNKSLMLIPHRFAIRCIDEIGLILRNDIIWAKRNAMPESVTDRFSKKHEFIFFFVKQKKYYFNLDAIRDKISEVTIDRCNRAFNSSRSKFYGFSNDKQNKYKEKILGGEVSGKNPGDVSDFWDITTKSNNLNHYATYNFDLIDKPIIAGCPENGIILDPFCGTGTTLVRAIQLGRKAIGIDGNMEYVSITNKRISDELKQLKLI